MTHHRRHTHRAHRPRPVVAYTVLLATLVVLACLIWRYQL